MSGIYIPSVEMPKEKGPHKIEIRLYVRADGTAGLWGIETYIPHEPLDVIPVPDHGRLIDADKVMAALSDMAKEYPKNPLDSIGGYMIFKVRGAIEKLPTIIEAEGEP